MKTSVYLTEDQQAGLSKVAALTGRAQADLLRDGVDQVLNSYLRTRPAMTARATGATVVDRMDDLMTGFGR